MASQGMLGTQEAVVGGTEGGPGPTGVPPTISAAELPGERAAPRPYPAVPEKALRRRFGAEYKARILREADQATASGQLGALLRREGLYSSHLAAWWKQRDAASLEALAPKRRGRKAAPHSPLVEENKRLTREGAHLHRKLRRTEVILDVQKKLSQGLKIILGTELPPNDYESEP